ncbi:MAG: hypothetical protein Q9208_008364 [Pyrenodesmia sp. 3 TL-2023]
MTTFTHKEEAATSLMSHTRRASSLKHQVKHTAESLDSEENINYSTQRRHTHPDPIDVRDKIHFDPNLKKLLLPGLVRCLISWFLIGAFYISSWKYKDRVLSPRAKSQFDAVTVALSIALGLNVASALKAIALDLRWWILSIEKRPSKELVQIGIAVLGLTYSASPGIGDIYREPGTNNISISNMTNFAPTAGRFAGNGIPFLESDAAHVLGEIGSSYNFSMLPEEPLVGTPWASNPAGFWNGTDYWEYHFLDSAPSPAASGARYLAIYSDRIVKSTAICAVPPYHVTLEGQLAVVHLPAENRTINFPALVLGLESIYYLTTPRRSNDSGDGICGPGCANVKALEPAAGPPADGSLFGGSNGTYFYDCNITVSAAKSDLPRVKAAVAAQAIALSGQVHHEFQTTDELNLDQFVAYNFGLPFGEPQNNSVTGMASLMSRFAIGVISAAAQTNPPMFVQGSLPAQGVRLQFQSFLAFNLILVTIGVLQLVLVLATAAIVKRLVIPEEMLLSRQEAIRSRFVLSS